MERVRVAVIGLGWPGQRHLEAYLKQPDVEVVALCDSSQPLLTRTQAASGVACAFASVEDLLRLDGLDAVSVCLPNFLHAPVAIAALDSGRHVLLEKPLARTVAEGEQIAAAVAHSGKRLMMALNNRFRPDTLALKRLVDGGGLGEIYYAKAGWLRRTWNPIVRGWFTQRDLSGGGPLIDLGVHMLDLALWFMGNPAPAAVSGSTYARFREPVAAQIGAIDTEDTAIGFVRLGDGRTITIEATWVGHTEHPDYVYCQLFGDRGGAHVERFAGQSRLKVFTEPAAGLPLVSQPVSQPDSSTTVLASFDNETRHFIDCIRADREPSAPVGQGLDVLRILDALYRSAEAGREVVIGAIMALLAALLTPEAALAHGLFGNGEAADIIADTLINFAIPLAIMLAGAVIGIILSRWLGRGDTLPADAATEAPNDADARVEADEPAQKA